MRGLREETPGAERWPAVLQVRKEGRREWQKACRGGKKNRRTDSYGRHAKSNGGLVLTVPATDELCQERWDELTLAEKVQLLNSLPEIEA